MLFIQLYQLTLMVIVVASTLSSANFGDRQSLPQVEERITRQKHHSSPLKAEATAVVQPSYSFYHEQHTPPHSYHDGNRYYYQNPGHSYNYGYGNSYTSDNNGHNNAGHGQHGGNGAYNGYGNRYDVDQYNYHMPNNYNQEPNSYSYHYNHVQPPYSYSYYQPYEYHYSQPPYSYSYHDYKPYQYNYHNNYNY